MPTSSTKRLWDVYLWPQRKRMLIAAFFMILLSASTAAYIFVVQHLVDQANKLDLSGNVMTTTKTYALAILPILLVITLLSGLSNYAQRIYCNAIALNAVSEMQKKMVRSAHNRDYAAFLREPMGNLISKFTNDISVISNALIRALSNLVKELFTVIFTVAAMLWQNWALTLIVLVVYPLAAWPIIVISNRLRKNAKNVQQHLGQITSDLKESFGGARMIKAYGLEEEENERLGKIFDERTRLYLKLVSEQARIDPILEVLGGLAVAGVIIFGVYQVSSGMATPGSIAGIITGLLVLSPRARALGTLSTVISEGLTSVLRVFEVIDERPAITDAPNARDITNVKGAVAFKNVSFSYPDGTSALKDVSLYIAAGQTVALVGASGGGKSTLMNLLPRLYDVSGGEVLLDGQNIKTLTLKSLRRNMALVSQNVTLFNDSVAKNIGFGDLDASKEDIIKAAKAADAHDFIMRLPNGYDTILGEEGHSLSGGQRQRLSIARAILRNAPILLLDEATSALDADSEAKVQAALERLSKGRTTLVIAHRLSTVQQADHIYVIEKGKVIENGNHAALSQKAGGTYARLWGLQTG